MNNIDTTSADLAAVLATEPAQEERRRGRKRVLFAAGALLGIGALATGAAFTDQAFLNLNGSGAFGGSAQKYNIQVSATQEDTVAAVSTWLEANPVAEDIAPIVGAEALVPGGDAVFINIPVRNESSSFNSTLEIDFTNILPVASDPDELAANAAYADLLRIDVAQVDDASTVPTVWAATALTLDGAGATAVTALADLAATEGSVLVVKAYLVEGADAAATNAANGGSVQIQAAVRGESKN